MKARDHDREVRAIQLRHREAMAAEMAERERACSSLVALFSEEIACLKTERDEWRRMYEAAVMVAHRLKAAQEVSRG